MSQGFAGVLQDDVILNPNCAASWLSSRALFEESRDDRQEEVLQPNPGVDAKGHEVHNIAPHAGIM